jgi:uncharacterized protein (UPF0333 family)
MLFDNRGFASAEFIFVTLIALIIMGGMVSLISSEMDKTQTGDLGQARILGEKIATTINTVYANGNGYSIDLVIPTTPFSVNVIPGYVTVFNTSRNVNITIKLIPQNITTSTLTSNSKYHVINNGTIQFTQYT